MPGPESIWSLGLVLAVGIVALIADLYNRLATTGSKDAPLVAPPEVKRAERPGPDGPRPDTAIIAARAGNVARGVETETLHAETPTERAGATHGLFNSDSVLEALDHDNAHAEVADAVRLAERVGQPDFAALIRTYLPVITPSRERMEEGWRTETDIPSDNPVIFPIGRAVEAIERAGP